MRFARLFLAFISAAIFLFAPTSSTPVLADSTEFCSIDIRRSSSEPFANDPISFKASTERIYFRITPNNRAGEYLDEEVRLVPVWSDGSTITYQGFATNPLSGVYTSDMSTSSLVQEPGRAMRLSLQAVYRDPNTDAVVNSVTLCQSATFKYEPVASNNASCTVVSKIYRLENGHFALSAHVDTNNLPSGERFVIGMRDGRLGKNHWIIQPVTVAVTETGKFQLVIQIDKSYEGNEHSLQVQKDVGGLLYNDGNYVCEDIVTFDKDAEAAPSQNLDDLYLTPDQVELLKKVQVIADFNLCKQIPANTPQRAACEACVVQGAEDAEDPERPTSVYTALGCIKIDESSFLRQIIRLLLSVSGLIALLSILAAAFMLSTSQGDSNKVKQARELITAAVSGLLFIIFSTIILDFIGVQILRIPGLS